MGDLIQGKISKNHSLRPVDFEDLIRYTAPKLSREEQLIDRIYKAEGECGITTLDVLKSLLIFTYEGVKRLIRKYK